MKRLTTLAILLASTTLASASDNESFILQVGRHNKANVGQFKGNNQQGTAQIGVANDSVTAQQSNKGGANNSATLEIGAENKSTVGQLDGQNDQATVQAGVLNKATTLQGNEGANNDNASFTGQFGIGNISKVGQTVGANGDNNNATTLQFGAINKAVTTQNSEGGDAN